MPNDILGLMDILANKPAPLAEQKEKKIVDEGSTQNPDFTYLWDNCVLDESSKQSVSDICQKIAENRSRYEDVEKQLGIKWFFIAAIHYREANLSFKAAFHNGDKIIGTGQLTTHVPVGRGAFDTWEESVADACKLLRLDKISGWDIQTCLSIAEHYNGLGYRKHGIYSPYVWGGTNNFGGVGKFMSDGKFDANAEEKQIGVAAIFLGLGITD